MKKRITNLMALGLLVAFSSTAQIQTPAPSPAGSVYSKVGLTDVTIEYSRPKVKGRKIFGAGADYLQPYGQLWRAGANAGSKLTISTDANIGGVDVKAGTYMIYATPGEKNFSFKLYSDLTLGGNVGGYDVANEVLSVEAPVTRLNNKVEALTYNIADLSEDNTSASIELAWADVSVKVPVKVNFDDVVMKDIAAKTQVNPQNYLAAANYYFSTGKDLEQALKWMDMYLAAGENSAQFWNVHVKAQILSKMGKKKEAIAAAEDSMGKAKSANNDFGYIKRNEDLIAELKKK
ncbi:MAG: DUF2911 domain-containing protein [Cyclobacteriaceae bacterium]